MDELISVIVPVYNKEKYINRCINSIQEQTYKNIEIVLVDDGSSDNSGRICDEYAQNDNRIKVIHQDNAGCTNARKTGLKNASGSLIGFVDADDWIEPEMYYEMARIMKKESVDIVSSGKIVENYGGATEEVDGLEEGVYRRGDMDLYENMILTKVQKKQGIMPNLPIKLFRRNVIESSMQCVDDALTNGEDAACVYGAIMDADGVYVTKRSWDHYWRNNESITNTRNDNFYMQLHYLYTFLMAKAEKHPYRDVLVKQIQFLLFETTLKGMTYYLGFGEEASVPIYYFPVNAIIDKKKLIVYGAGKVGKAYYRQFKADNSYEVVAWVDRYKCGEEIQSVEILKQVEYDCVIVAVQYEDTARQIEQELVEMGIPEEKIIWKQPENYFQRYEVEEKAY